MPFPTTGYSRADVEARAAQFDLRIDILVDQDECIRSFMLVDANGVGFSTASLDDLLKVLDYLECLHKQSNAVVMPMRLLRPRRARRWAINAHRSPAERAPDLFG